MTCTQPGCTGSITDGYCDLCGMAAAPGVSAAAASPASVPVADGASCQQPGCSGAIADGYCDTCGMASAAGGVGGSTTAGPAAGRSAGPAAGPAAGMADDVSVATSASRVQSAAFGSERAGA
ncbi:MAG: serine/threonine protein kinase, partial [Nocardioides sp.]